MHSFLRQRNSTSYSMAKKRITAFLQPVMVATGSWRLKLTNNMFIQTIYNIYSVVFQLFLIGFLVSLILIFPTLLKKQDFRMLSENVGYTILTLVIFVKIVICQTAKIRNLIGQCIWEEARMYKEDPLVIRDNFENGVKVLNYVNSVVLPLSISALLTFCFAKYTEYADNKYLNATVEKPLPIPIWYPFDPNKYYGTAVTIGLCFAMVAGLYNVVTQILFITLVTHVALQLKSLKIFCANFHLYCAPYDNDYDKEKSILDTLRIICVKHQSIISFVDKLNIAIRNVLLLEFLLNSLNIASVMIQVFILPNTPPMMAFCVIFCIVLVTQLFITSWHANEIEIQSESICDALFQSRWYEQSEKAKKIISIIIMRARKPLRLFIGPFYPISLRTALGTLKAAYSYVTLVFTLAAEE